MLISFNEGEFQSTISKPGSYCSECVYSLGLTPAMGWLVLLRAQLLPLISNMKANPIPPSAT